MRRLTSVALVALALLATPRAVAAGEGGVTISGSDASAFPAVELTVSIEGPVDGAALGPADVTVRENGVVRPVTAVTSLEPEDLEVVVVMDRSGSMAGAAIDNAREAARRFAVQLPPSVAIGLVTFGSSADVALAPTLDRLALDARLAAVAAGGGTSLYDGVVLASTLFSPETERRVIVLLSDGGDTESVATLDAAVASVTGVQVNVIELVSSEANGLALAMLAGAEPVRSAADPLALAQAYDDVARALVNRVVVTYTSARPSSGDSEVEVSIAVGGVTRSASGSVAVPATPNTVPAPVGPAAGASAGVASPPSTVPVAPSTPVAAPVPTSEPAGRSGPPMLGAGLVFGGLLLAAVTVWRRPDESMRSRLRPLPSAALVTSSTPERPRRSIETMLEQALERRSRRERIDSALEAAGSELKATDIVLRTALGAGLAGLLAMLLTSPVIAIAVAVAIPWYVKSRVLKQGAKRRRQFVEQLPDVLQVLSSMLRSGYGLMQSLDAMAAEANDPSREWFQRVILEVRTGRDVVQSLKSLSDRIDSVDFAWVVAAIEINREVGGDLARTLESLADTIRDRDRLRRQVRTLTAEGRMSAYLMLALPPLVALFSSVTNPDFFGVLFEGAGIVVLMLAGLLMVIGYAWMRTIIAKVM